MDVNDWWADYDHYGPLHELATNDDDDDGVGVITNTNTYMYIYRNTVKICSGVKIQIHLEQI